MESQEHKNKRTLKQIVLVFFCFRVLMIPVFHAKTKDQTIKELDANADLGLTFSEAISRQKKFGKNTISETKPPRAIFIFLKQFNSFFTIILLVAALLSLILKEYIDFGVIIAAVSLNIFIGFAQEFRAEKIIFILRKMSVTTAKVLRDGKVHKVLAEDLVPGDIIFIDAGDKIPADCRLIEAIDFHTKEALLTGESTPSKKKDEKIFPEKTVIADRENMIYMGTIALSGRAKAIATAIGTQTELGKIAADVAQIKEKETPLQTKMKSLSLEIAFVIFALLLLILFLGLSRGKSLEEMFLTTVALAVAAIPEGLLVAVTVILTLSMRRILQKKALVRELIAAETLGSTTVICTDKTGTITTGEMSVEQIITVDKNYQKNNLSKNDPVLLKILEVGLLCNDVYVENDQGEEKTWKFLGDPTEVALLYPAARLRMYKEEYEKKYPLIDEIPFDSYLKYMAAMRRDTTSNNLTFFVKGSCERILGFSNSLLKNDDQVSTLTDDDKKKFLKLNEQLSQKSYRVLACGYKSILNQNIADLKKEATSNLIFLGLVALRDPIRKSISSAISTCQNAGIQVKMITGDHKNTARAIGEEVGITANNDEILCGEDLDFMPPAELSQKICKAKIFARVAPKHKLQIVDSLQERKEIVAMTGDGVNDTPALKAANIGIAMGTGSEAAKETASMVLLDNNFKTIESAVEEGRIIFDNIRKVTLYLFYNSFVEIILIGGSLLLGLPMPLLPTQILWLNIVEDGLPTFALTLERGEKEVMQDKPRSIDEPILSTQLKSLIFFVSSFISLILFVAYFYFTKNNFDIIHIRSMLFAAIGLSTVTVAFSCKNLHFAIWQKNPFSNKILVLNVFIGIIFLFAALYLAPLQNILETVPLSLDEWGFVLGFAIFNFVLFEIVKNVFIKKT